MATKVYVDILLVLNYVINMMLITCTAKLSGRHSRRLRLVAASLLGAAGSLVIFLPFQGFAASIASKLAMSAILVLVAFPFINRVVYCKQIFLFFAVSFFFAGIMLGIWMLLQPAGMLYYNGVVYFDISSLTLIVTTVIAYALLSLFHRFSRGGRLREKTCRVELTYQGRTARVTGLLDTGNGLCEPFSGTPVIVCHLDAVAPLFTAKQLDLLHRRAYLQESCADSGLLLRMIPCKHVGGRELLPAVRADRLLVVADGSSHLVERAYIGLTEHTIGDGRYGALCNPDMTGINIMQGGGAI